MNYAEYIAGEYLDRKCSMEFFRATHKVADALHENISPRKIDRSHVVSVQIYGHLYGQLPTFIEFL